MRSCGDKGFTLIEVTFSLMIMTLGLFAVYHLFPSGLRASVDSNAFTRQSMFAEECFGAIRAQAAAEWESVFADDTEVELSDGTIVPLDGTWTDAFIYPASTSDEEDMVEEYVRCKVAVALSGANAVLGQVTLHVRHGRVGSLSETFYTELYDYGM